MIGVNSILHGTKSRANVTQQRRYKLMKKNTRISQEERALFRQSLKGVRRLDQDRVVHPAKSPDLPRVTWQKSLAEQKDASFYFSDEFQPQLATDGPTRYIRADSPPHELKKLRRGDYCPELFLDLHGLTQQQAKQELGALIAACQREQVDCACIMHGHGKQILKRQIPCWLAQHPDVIAFHQAPNRWGGTAALLILVVTHAKR